MANNLVSDQLPVQSIQMGQLEYISNKLDSPMQMGLTPGFGNSALQPISIPNVQMGLMENDVLSQESSIQNNQALLESMPYSNVPQGLATSNVLLGQRELQAYNEVPGPYFLSNKQAGEIMLNNVRSQQSSVLNKRKAPVELLPSNSVSPKSTVANRRMAQMEHRPWLQQISTPNRLPVQVQPVSNTSGSQRSQVPFKRPALNKNGSQQTSVQKNQSGQRQPTVKSQNEPLESVRSKLRESLAAALALVSQQQDRISSTGKNSQNEATSSMEQMKESLQPSGHDFDIVDTTRHAFEKTRESLPRREDSLAQRGSDGEKISQQTADENTGNAQAARNDVEELQSSIILHHGDISFSDSFFARDELLQGNGLSWVLEPDMEMTGREAIEIAQKQLDRKSLGKNNGAALQTPEDLASKIETELFKLFGGVNKKYKEKGRSLLFNLKDRNNPELSERVMSGEIPPKRLCSMTAEELASEELSQWRMAKAEELAQMVVLPDSDVDMRRLVKKTHKGEFQVEVEQQDSMSVEVAVGVSSTTPVQPKLEEKEVSPRSKPDAAKDNHRTKFDQAKDKIKATSAKHNTEEEDVPCTITICSNEGTDLMQGLMVDDELKDAEFLPPIVSLDEFMESLNSEPPFEHLPGDNGKMSFSDKDHVQVESESKSPVATPEEATVTIPDEPDNIDVKNAKLDDDKEANPSHETGIPVGLSEGERVWEGALQLNTSATASVLGIFKCGEKTSVKEWPGFIEIKGRVRLDAFEKFLQELPMSRSRAVMAVHIVCKEGSGEGDRSSLGEVADAYVLDGRVGLAEPARGFELYLCPPHSRTREMLSKVFPRDQLDALNAIDNGLIGVIVWRKAQLTSTPSPNSASYHKHNMKKHFTSRRHQEKDTTNTNVNATPKHALSHGGPRTYPKPQPDQNVDDDDDDDDVPPGFGPLPTRDEDDLPEFSFTSGSITPRSQTSHKPIQGRGMMTPFHPRAQTPTRPVDQMRELVQRYGQPKSSVTGPAAQPWNDDDDDDDMPEWRPEGTHSQPTLVQSRQQPMLRAHLVQQSHHQQLAPSAITPGVTFQPQLNVMHGLQGTTTSWQQGGWVVPPPGTHGPPPYNQPDGGQIYGSSEHGAGQQGMTWRRDAPKSRGF